MLKIALMVLIAYVIGSIPFPVIVSHLAKGIDLREHGSGNMGATNAGRVLGKKWFPVVFGLDLTKGLVAALLLKQVLPAWAGIDPVLAWSLGGLAVVVGHCFPVFAGFKGGVGLAATAGALLAISLPLVGTMALTILLGWALSRNMYVGTAVAALLYPLMGWYWLGSAPAATVLAIWGAVVFGLHVKDLQTWLARRAAR